MSETGSAPPDYRRQGFNSENLLPHPEVGDTEAVIAIDFGTTFTGVAYRIVTAVDKETATLDAAAINEQTKLLSTWPGGRAAALEKIPSVLSYRDNGELMNWGLKVSPRQGIRVAHFKLGLQDVAQHYKVTGMAQNESPLGGFLHDPQWKDTRLPDKKAVDYAADYLSCVRNYIAAKLGPLIGSLENDKVSFVITVPAIWRDRAKELTRQAASRAGFADTRLAFISEPEAAALYCATISKDVELQQGDTFVVCDAGGGTVVSIFVGSKADQIRTLSLTRLLHEIHSL
jgi:molecular chaperone DnaK (HSP70)